jgi:hypothetical protein
MPRARSCRPPRTVSVRGHWRQVRKTRKKKRAPRPLPYVVYDTRNGRVVSRHKSLTAAWKAERRYDRASYRRGQGRPYNTRKA